MIRSLACFLLSIAMAAQATEIPSSNVEPRSFNVVKTIMPFERFLEGSVEAISQATVSAETSGRVDQIRVDVGDSVLAGTVILTLVGVDQKEGLNQAQALLNESIVQRQAEAQQFARVKVLYDKKLLSKANYDSASASYNSAKARVSSAEAALNRARQQVSYTEIKAAYSGVVSARHVEVGEAVQPGMPLMSGFDPDRLRGFVDLPQSIATSVRLAPDVHIVLNNGTKVRPAKTTLFPIADARTGTVRMRLELPESVSVAYPGALVKVAVKLGEQERLLVPVSSVVYRSEVAGVYILNANQPDSLQSNLQKLPQLRQIRVGSRFGDQVEILAGLMVGENIATDPIAAGIAASDTPVLEGQ
ncbi:efflux RND transporter periplasmic adaptor subunit [Neptunomonas antarctica]|uniref:RND family efflux transporter, MFP subunit n=1 Tax=Neptunomonas antarctica TaxID=619304 RepID=A0A1N7K7T3_9GAMM|nr:efflux RND transporter periplasmic adaptor subunit [Neptunomonas antarctica]SIS57633.1 RND family efflux transporter, MFP subunit [Neptunomonas antarctica]